MSKGQLVAVVALAALLWAGSARAQTHTVLEENFDGPDLSTDWNVWGDGSYSLNNGDLEFQTREGDFERYYEGEYGAPHHMFLTSVPGNYPQWSITARVRYNTPDERYEQVSVMAYEDNDNYVKLSYHQGGPGHEHTLLEEHGSEASDVTPVISPYSDYFWLRLDRDGSTFEGRVSADTTTDPDLVNWTLIGSVNSPVQDPKVGIAGWNTRDDRSGELAEFDYVRVQIPEPATLSLLGFGMGGLVCFGRRRRGDSSAG